MYRAETEKAAKEEQQWQRWKVPYSSDGGSSFLPCMYFTLALTHLTALSCIFVA
jgi:hypothetical protein